MIRLSRAEEMVAIAAKSVYKSECYTQNEKIEAISKMNRIVASMAVDRLRNQGVQECYLTNYSVQATQAFYAIVTA